MKPTDVYVVFNEGKKTIVTVHPSRLQAEKMKDKLDSADPVGNSHWLLSAISLESAITATINKQVQEQLLDNYAG